jgi:hypothetical protein
MGPQVSQHERVAVLSADGQRPAGHCPASSYETSPLLSQLGQIDPQHGWLVPCAMHVPLGQAPPVGAMYPFEPQYPPSAPPVGDAAVEHARKTKERAARKRMARPYGEPHMGAISSFLKVFAKLSLSIAFSRAPSSDTVPSRT